MNEPKQDTSMAGQGKKDYRELDRLEAERFSDAFIATVNADHCDSITLNRDIGCRIRDHIETLRRENARLSSPTPLPVQDEPAEPSEFLEALSRSQLDHDFTPESKISSRDKSVQDEGEGTAGTSEFDGVLRYMEIAKEKDRAFYSAPAAQPESQPLNPKLWLDEAVDLVNLYHSGYAPKDVAAAFLEKCKSNWNNVVEYKPVGEPESQEGDANYISLSGKQCEENDSRLGPFVPASEYLSLRDDLSRLREELRDRNEHIKCAYASLGEVSQSIYLFDHIQTLKEKLRLTLLGLDSDYEEAVRLSEEFHAVSIELARLKAAGGETDLQQLASIPSPVVPEKES
jgi:hypothetical protein